MTQKKHKWKTSEPKKLIKNMWYAMPEKLAHNPKIMEHIPDFAGVLSCYSIKQNFTYFNNGKHVTKLQKVWKSDIIKPAKVNSKARKMTEKERIKLLRLGMIRYWSFLEKNI